MFLRSWYVRRELRALRKEFGSKKISIYDAGTGFGQYSHYMAKKLQPNEIFAVDVKSEWIDDCRSFFEQRGITSISFAVEDLTEIEHRERFDLILCVDVMEHIVEDVKVFENYYRALKPGGFVLINSPSIYGGSDVHEDDDESFIGEHARDGYSADDLTGKMEPLGFDFYRSNYSYGFWGDKAWRLGIKFPMLLLNVSKIFFLILPFYYALTLPFTLFMMLIDYQMNNETGSGITYIARKPNKKMASKKKTET